METALAPSVVMPPCPRSRAWKSSTMVPITTITHGPKRMAPRPTPVGCEELPVTEGSLSAESTKQKPPAAARSRRVLGFSLMIRFVWTTPLTTNGAAMRYQTTQKAAGR